MLEYWGGVPELVIPDNEKAAVRRASRYEPDIKRLAEIAPALFTFRVSQSGSGRANGQLDRVARRIPQPETGSAGSSRQVNGRTGGAIWFPFRDSFCDE